MADKRIEFVILERLEEDQKKATVRLNEIDEKLIGLGKDIDEINRTQAAQAVRPIGWGKVAHWTKEWGGTGAAASVIIFGLGIWHSNTVFTTRTDVRLENVEKQVALLTTTRLQRLSDNPSNPQNANESAELLKAARHGRIRIDAAAVADSGLKFLQASVVTPEVWPAVNEFVSYRSFLNIDLLPKLGKPRGSPTWYKLLLNVRPRPGAPIPTSGHDVEAVRVNFYGEVPAENSARLEGLDDPLQVGSGNAYIVMEAFTEIIGLDGYYMKNVIVENSIVEYNGGPLRLENVYFVNCSFITTLTPKTRELGKNLLASAPTTFSAVNQAEQTAGE